MYFTLVGSSSISVPLLLAAPTFNVFSSDWVRTALLVLYKDGSLCSCTQLAFMECVRYKISVALGTVLSQGKGVIGCVLDGVAIGGFVSLIRAPHGDCMLTCFVGLGREAARFKKKSSADLNLPLLMLWCMIC